MTPRWISALLGHSVIEALARVLLTFPFWGSGLDKLMGFGAATSEMAHFGLQPAWAFAVATIVVQLGGSALIIARRLVWLGAGALGIFTALTIPIVHTFWRLEGEAAVRAIHTAGEHVGMIGGLVLVSILALRPAGTAGVSR